MRILWFILLLILVTSCSEDLTRSEAEDLIKELKQFPIEKGDELKITHYPGVVLFDRLKWNALQREGMVTFTTTKNALYGKLTEEGSEFARGPVRRAGSYDKVWVVSRYLDFKEITGIRPHPRQDNTMIVEYLYFNKKVTPFGRIMFDWIEGESFPYEVEMQKFDDGWRITKE